MNKIKRHSNIGDFHVGKNKKRALLENVTCIENLSNELFLAIFDYLDGCDIYKSFSNLNKRFTSILSNPLLRIKICLSSEEQLLNIQNYLTNIILPNRHEIISISLLNSLIIDSFIQSKVFNSLFTCLESIIISDIKSSNLLSFLLTLTSLPKLYLLMITVGDRNMNDFSNAYRLILNLPVLKYNKLSFGSSTSKIFVRNISSHCSSIKHLNMNHVCNLNDLANIFSYTPNLSRFVCTELTQSYQSIEKLPISLPYLTHVSIRTCSLQFSGLEILLRKISNHLKNLRIYTSNYTQYLDADRWEQLISEFIPDLYTFYFQFDELIDDAFQITADHQLVDRFNSSFWYVRGWVFKLTMHIKYSSPAETVYSIHPYKYSNDLFSSRKRWYEFYESEDDKEHFDSNGTELIVLVSNSKGFNEEYIDKMSSFFNTIQITKLDITFEATFAKMLLNLLHHLPNLNSLRLSSLLLKKSQNLNGEQDKNFEMISVNNRIRKVNIQRMTDLIQVQFLIDLCRYMEYFEIGISNNFDMKLLLEFILIKNYEFINHLHVLSFYIKTANDKIVEELQNIILFNRLQDKFIVKRIDHRIFIQRSTDTKLSDVI